MKWKKLMSGILSAAMLVTSITPTAAAVETVPVETADAVEVEAVEEVVGEAADTANLLAEFTFDGEDPLESETAKAVGDYATVDYNGGKALSLSNKQFLTVTKPDGTPLLEGQNEITISYDAQTSDAGDRANAWAFFANVDAKAPTDGHAETYLGVMHRMKTITLERFVNGRGEGSITAKGDYSGWNHVDMVLTTNSKSIYVNGELAVTGESTTDLTQIFGKDSIFLIGKATWGGGEYYTGLIDNFRVYDGALTAEAVAKEYETGAAATPAPVPEDPNAENLMLYYDFVLENSKSTVINDASGHGKAGNMKAANGASVEGNYEIEDTAIFGKAVKALSLPGGSEGTYLQLPDNIFKDMDAATISMWVNLSTDTGYQRIWDFGKGSGSEPYMYLLSDGWNTGFKGYAAAICPGGWDKEVGVQKETNIGKNRWVLTTVVMDGSKMSLYENGQLIGTNENTGMTLKDLGETNSNYIGYGQYKDAPTKGQFAEVKIYNKALTAEEVSAMYPYGAADMVAEDKAALSLEKDTYTEDFELPTTGVYGSEIKWESDNAAIAVDGGNAAVTRPASEEGDAKVILTATITNGEAVETKTFEVTVIAEMGDADIVANDKEKLTLGDTSALVARITLPSTGELGSTITWETSDASVIKANGRITRPEVGQPNGTATLTATITYGEATETKTFDIVVLAKPETKTIESYEAIEVTTEVKKAPALPNFVKVTYSNKTEEKVRVTWPSYIAADKYAAVGSFEVQGTLQDSDYEVKATVNVVEKNTTEVDLLANTFNLDNITLDGDSILTQNRARTLAYLKLLDADRMLYNFRKTFGQDTLGAKPLGGWDAPTGLLRGHSTGHFLSALALAYGSTKDADLKKKLDYMITEMRKLQVLSEGNAAEFKTKGVSQEVWSTDPKTWGKGFISAYSPDQFALLEDYVPYAQIWAPYYTLHKLMAGFLDAYTYAGNEEALEIAKDLGLWVYDRLSVLPQEQLTKMWDMYIAGELGGMNESMAQLYRITKDERYLAGAKLFDNTKFFDKLAVNYDDIANRHANQHIPQIVGALELYQATVDAGKEETYYYDVAKNFWEMVVSRYAYSIGGVGTGEKFQQPYKQANNIKGTENCETCAAYNMLKLTKDLYQYDPENAEYMDYYERTLYNQILASQSSIVTDDMHNGTTYMLPIGPGATKGYGDDYNSFTCCHGTGMENHVKYQEAAYYRTNDTMYVNLYIPSTVTWSDKGVVVKQENAFPSETTKLTVSAIEGKEAQAFDMKLRVPYWAEQGFEVKVNGTAADLGTVEPTSYVTVNVKAGDVIEISMPFGYHLDATPDKLDGSTIASVMYGPLVMVTKDRDTNWKTLVLSTDLNQSITTDKTAAMPTIKISGMTFTPMYSIGDYSAYHTYFKVIQNDDDVSFFNVTVTNRTQSYGTITTSAELVKEDDNVTITAKPAANYVLKSLTVNGKQVELREDNTYVIGPVTENISVVGSFALDPAYTTASVSNATPRRGSFTLSSNVIKKGEDLTITAKPKAGYEVKTVTANVPVEATDDPNVFVIKNVQEAVAVEGSFRQIDPPAPDPAMLEKYAEPAAHYTAGWENLYGINSEWNPTASNFGTGKGWGNWPQDAGSWAWVSYSWDVPVTVNSNEIYWYDDGGGTRVPQEINFEYLDENGEWQNAEITSTDYFKTDCYNTIDVKPITTTCLRLNMKIHKDGAACGIGRWKVSGPAEQPPVIPRVLADFDFDDEETGFASDYGKATGKHELKDSYAASTGKALYLDGTAEKFLNVTDKDGGSLLTGVEEMTVSFEMKSDRTNAANWPFFAAPNANKQDYLHEHYIGLLENTGALTAERYNNNGARAESNKGTASSTDWFRIDLVYKQAGTDLYVNGEKQGETVASNYKLSDILGDSSVIQIGKANWNDGEFFKGWIDNLSIVSKALSAKEIKANADEFLKLQSADKTALQKAVDAAKELKEADYTAGSWKAFSDALTAAEAVLAKEDASQKEANDALEALTAAKEALVKPADKTALQAAIDAGAELKKDDYTATSWTAYEEALKAANDLIAKEDATQKEVDAAAEALKAAQEALVKPADKAALQEAVDAAISADKKNEYTATSWAPYEEALNAANDLLAKEDATQDEVDAAAAALKAAQNALVKAADKTALQEAVDAAIDADKKDGYTAESWKTYEDALNAANDLLAKEDATQDEVDAAAAALKAAQEGLVKNDLALKAAPSASFVPKWENINGINNPDFEPTNSAFATGLGWGNWDGANEPGDVYWAAYTWDTLVEISSNEIYWYDDEAINGSTRVPSAVTMEYLDKDGLWKPVTITSENYLQKDQYNALDVEPITTSQIRVNLTIAEGAMANGIGRWKVYGKEVGGEPYAPVDKTALQAAIDAGADLKKDDYTGNSWARYSFALKAAQDLLAKEDATQEEVDAAAAELKAAQEALVKAADKKALQAAIDAGAELKQEDYTADSWAAYKKALEDAGKLLGKDDATQDEVDKAVEALKAAQKALVKAEKPIEIPEVLADFDFDDEETGLTSAYGKATGKHELKDSYSASAGKALYLDGTSENFLSVTNKDGGSLLTGVKEMTVSFEMKSDRTGTANWPFFAAPNANEQVYQKEHYIGLLENTGALTAERYNNSGARAESNKGTASSTDWFRIDLVYTEAGTDLYVNGEKQGETVASNYKLTDILGDSSIIQIGKANWTANGEYFKGWIDNFSIVSKVLSAEEIKKNADAFLKPQGADKTALQAAVDAAISADKKDEYTADSWAAYEKALKAAKDMLAKADAAQADVDAAAKALTDAQKALKKVEKPTPVPADKKALQAAVDAAISADKKDEYTADSWAAYEKALKAAKDMLAKTDAVQADVDAAAKALTDAQKALKKVTKPTPVPANKAALQAAVDVADSKKQADYTADTWAALQSVLMNAQAVLAKADATQAEVDAALTAVNAAMNALVSIETPEPPIDHSKHIGMTFYAGDLKYKITKDNGKVQEVRVTSLKNKKAAKVVIPKKVTCTKLGETFKVTSIKAKAFKGKNIKKAVIGANVTKIGPNAFLNCKKLTTVTIGKNVKSIGVRAFYGCAKLKKVTIKSKVLKNVKKNAFKRISRKAVIKVPKGKKNAYKNRLKGKIAKGVKIK